MAALTANERAYNSPDIALYMCDFSVCSIYVHIERYLIGTYFGLSLVLDVVGLYLVISVVVMY